MNRVVDAQRVSRIRSDILNACLIILTDGTWNAHASPALRSAYNREDNQFTLRLVGQGGKFFATCPPDPRKDNWSTNPDRNTPNVNDVERIADIGVTGWAPDAKLTHGFGFEIDSDRGHKDGLSDHHIELCKNILRERLGCGYITTSPSGHGTHGHVEYSEPVPTSNRREHQALVNETVRVMSDEMGPFINGVPFSDIMDVAGGNIWVYTTRPGLQLIHNTRNSFDVGKLGTTWRERFNRSQAARDSYADRAAGTAVDKFNRDFGIDEAIDAIGGYEILGGGEYHYIGSDQTRSASQGQYPDGQPGFTPFSTSDDRFPHEGVMYAAKDVIRYGLFDGDETQAQEFIEEHGYANDYDEFKVLKKPEEIKKVKSYGFTPVPVDELMAQDLKLEYLVDRAFVGEGTMFIGGREKTFKTGIAVDLLISLSTKTKFLGEFDILDTRSSVIFTAEIGMPAAQQLIKRISKAKDVDPFMISDMDVVDSIPSFRVDKMGNPTNTAGIRGLKQYLDQRKPQVAVFDPLYFAMGGAAVGDMYEVGAILKIISDICTSRDILAILCHHARKGNKEEEARPMELNDLYGAGVGAYARQWALLSHQQPFSNGRASMYLNMGGSAAGDRGLWELAINEGQADGILERVWEVSVERSGSNPFTVSDPELEEAVRKMDRGKGVTIADVKQYTRAPSLPMVDNALRKLVDAGRLKLMPGYKFEINEKEGF